jgi:hypothetical protein
MDISHSPVAIGREFSFPIDFSAGKHAKLHLAPGAVKSYARDLALQLSSCGQIAELLVEEQRCWHRKLVNSRRRNLCIFSVGNIVFA